MPALHGRRACVPYNSAVKVSNSNFRTNLFQLVDKALRTVRLIPEAQGSKLDRLTTVDIFNLAPGDPNVRLGHIVRTVPGVQRSKYAANSCSTDATNAGNISAGTLGYICLPPPARVGEGLSCMTSALIRAESSGGILSDFMENESSPWSILVAGLVLKWSVLLKSAFFP
jgi:hypothetical protein